jgi:two-component system sensor histidine kinase/response regulator
MAGRVSAVMLTDGQAAPVADEIAPSAGDGPDLSSLSGIDAGDGLRRASGNVTLYRRLLGQFAEFHPEDATLVRKALDEDDLRTAERIAHSLKGSAGNIGASSVQTEAGLLEKLLRSKADAGDVERARLRLASELATIVASLQPFLRTRPEPETDDRPQADPQAVRNFLKTLLSQLEDGDPAAIETVAGEKHALRALFPADELHAFESLIDGYSFEEALDRLRAAALKTGLDR